jgi:formylglycine-generating enzyme required for sulfatase activity/curli biogenesis system outer membrane secretion channel CsgG
MFLSPRTILAQQIKIDTEVLAEKIAKSVNELVGNYRTIAISRIKQRSRNRAVNIEQLIDYTNVKIVRGERFRVTDRSKLQLILKEQKVQLSEFVSPNEYRELGKLLGVELFIYGTIYGEALILKAIDVQNSSIAWAGVYPISQQLARHQMYTNLSQSLLASLQQSARKIENEEIQRVSFWDIESPAPLLSEEIIDYLTVAIANDKSLKLIDRENLKLIYNEQKLNQEIYIDENQARRLGELYGVDAFLYGNISKRIDGEFVASMKMMNVFSGVITWADLLKFRENEEGSVTISNPFSKKVQERLERNKGNGMIAISGGMFLMGTDDPLYANSNRRLMRVRPFQIDQTEVSNGDYLGFVEANNHRRPVSWIQGMMLPENAKLPVVGISWEDARMYCRFLSKRLPTEAEWERTARGTQGRKYPWGPSFSPNFSVTRESGIDSSVNVESANRDQTPEGVRNLAGNVREYVSDAYRPGGRAERISESNNLERVVRGSSWAFGSFEAAGFYRGYSRPNLAWPDVGFRCANDL